MKTLAELMSTVRPVWAPEDAGAGAATQAATGANDSVVAGAGADSVAAGAGDGTQAAGAAAAAAEKPKGPDWKDKRIATLTARLNAKNTAAPAEPAKPLDPTADFNRRVAEEAQRLAPQLTAMQKFDEACLVAVTKGKEEYGDKEFVGAVNALRSIVDETDAASQATYTDLIESALETGAAPAIIFDLGSNLDEAQKLFDMSPKRRAVELTRKAAALGGAAESSTLPKPIVPVESRGARHEAISPSDPARSDNLSTADWMARREAEIKTRSGARA